MVVVNQLYYQAIVIVLSYCCLITKAEQYPYNEINTHSPMPVSGRILAMLKDRNAILNSKPIHKFSASTDSYFGLMRRLAEKENVQYQLAPTVITAEKVPYLHYLPQSRDEHPDGTKALCRRLRMC